MRPVPGRYCCTVFAPLGASTTDQDKLIWLSAADVMGAQER
jgi:hypothetical protein